jgi:phosphatidylglycerophosphate synthase
MADFKERIHQARALSQPAGMIEKETYYSLFLRRYTIYVSYFFCKLGFTANQVTYLMIICGVVGSICYVPRNIFINLAGIIFFHLWYFLDCVDGEVARLRNQCSLVGIYFDEASHIVVNSLFTAALGIHLYLLYPSTTNLLLTLLLYSGWHWLRELARVKFTVLAVKSDFNPQKARENPAVTPIRAKIAKIAGFFTSSLSAQATLEKAIKTVITSPFHVIHGRTIVGIVLLVSYINMEILKYFCWIYAVSIMVYCMMMVCLDIRGLPRDQKH